VDIRFHLALAMENVNDLDGAREQLMVILRDLDHYNADAYNEIGRVILESRPTDMSDYEAAVESFKAAIKLNPNLAGARRNLALAIRMLASTRPATRSATEPATQP
jgi:tetratricopeptide (TPR) repeat protein